VSIIKDPYYSRSEVSNSDLGALEKYFERDAFTIDLTAAFRFGSLLDAMITEPEQVDYFKMTVAGEPMPKDEFVKAGIMKAKFFADPMCKHLASISEMQKVTIKHDFEICYEGINFKLDMRAKWDFFVKDIDMSGDLKTTASTTQKQFEDSISHYNYDRQAALYMDLEGKTNFIFLGISKTAPHKIFKVPVKKGSPIYNAGKAKYQELAWRYFYLFGDLSKIS
jgi:hypothetical protein